MSSTVSTVARALDRWIDAPASLLGERLQAMRPGNRILVGFSQDETSLVLSGGRQASLDAGLQEESLSILRPALAEKSVTVVVPRTWIIERQVDLPLEAASHLEGIVASRVSTLSPVPPHETLFGHCVLSVDRAQRKLAVGIVILPKARIARALELFDRLSIRDVAIETPFADSGSIMLYPRRSGAAAGHRRTKTVLSLLLGASLVSAFSAVAAGPLLTSYYEGRQAEFDARARAAREIIASAVAPAHAATAPAQAALDIKNDSVSALGALEDLAAALPNHAYATEISFAEGRIRLAGRTSDLPDVLTALESSGRFLDSKLVGAALREANGSSSDFELETRPLIRTGGALR